jgi:RimJ/RimL family protein N-acetyltransferase
VTGGFAPAVTVEGLGLVLREWTDADVPAMVELFDETEVGRWTPLRHPFDAAAARTYLDRARTRRAEGLAIQLAITTGGHAPLGEVLLFSTGPDGRAPGGDQAELGYAIGAAHRGKRLASRAVRLMTGYAYRELGMRAVVLHIDPGNAGSVAVARATGFELAGTIVEDGHELGVWRHRPAS